jgi:hypothetical protein
MYGRSGMVCAMRGIGQRCRKLTVNDFIINVAGQVSFSNEAVVEINRPAS